MHPLFLSKEKLAEIEAELAVRRGEKRKELAERIGLAKDQGDLSENFEYHNAKELQAENETEIFRLEEMLKNAVVVDMKKGGTTIGLGSRFTVKMKDGATRQFMLVGAAETDPIKGKISNDSPLGNAFLGKSVGDTASFEGPNGIIEYTIQSLDEV